MYRLAGIPDTFTKLSNVLPTYQFIDFASGTGIVDFYAGDTVDAADGGNRTYLLSSGVYYSDEYVTSASIPYSAGSVYSKVLDLDFDVLLNRPLNVAGNVVLNVPISINAPATTRNNRAYIIAKFRKWDGATETDIASVQSDPFINNSTGQTYRMKGMPLTIPLTTFKIGEYIRLTIEVWAMFSLVGTSGGTVYIAYDPMNRTTGWDTTGAVPSRLVFQLPVRLNL